MKIAALGRNSIDRYYECPLGLTLGEKIITSFKQSYFGGMMPNTACILSALGVPTTLFDTIGDDPLSRELVRDVAQHGVDISHMHFDSNCTTPVNHILLSKVNSDEGSTIIVPQMEETPYSFNNEALSSLKDSDILYSTISNMRSIETLDLVQIAHENGVKLILDVENNNFRSREEDQAIFQEAHIIFFNQMGFEKFAGNDNKERVIKSLLNKDGKIIVVTRGKEGCRIYTEEETIDIPGISVKYIDTTGAGDTFNALFIWGWLQGESIVDTANQANHGAALSTTREGPRSLLHYFVNGKPAFMQGNLPKTYRYRSDSGSHNIQ